MNYKEEIMNALADVCKRARKEGYEEADSNQCENAVYEYERGYEEGLKRGEDIEQANAAETKKEVAKQNYERGLNDAWECARKIGKVNWLTLKQIGFEIKDKEKNPSWDVVMEYSASEVITKIKEYEEKQNQTDDKIKFGDEVDVPQLDCKGIVIAEANKETILVLSEYMDGLIRTEKHNVKKTGRYFSEIGEMKKKMQVDDKDN